MPSSTVDPVELFLKSWHVYQDIIKHNYMFHRDISTAVQTQLQSYKPDQPLRVLDLGCGDASMTLPLLSRDRISAYIGCDLSQPALEIAHTQLENLGIPYQLACSDMLEATTQQAASSTDIVFSSYAIHHLDTNSKRRIIEAIHRALSPGAIFVLIDIFREPGESHADYMTHYMGFLKDHWVELSPESQALVINHATQYDFPETSTYFDAQCQAHGFAPGRRLSKHTWHEAWLYTKTI